MMLSDVCRVHRA